MERKTFFWVVAAGLVACSSKSPTTKEYWDELLGSPEKRAQAFLRMQGLKDKAQIDAAMKALGAVVDRNQAQVAGVVERLGVYDAAVAAGLRKCVLNETVGVQCARGLGFMRAAEAVPELKQAVRAQNAFVRHAAVQALRWIRAKDAVDVLGELVVERGVTPRTTPGPQRPSGEAAVREAVLALGELDDTRAIPHLVRAIWAEVWTSYFPEARTGLVRYGEAAARALIAAIDGQAAGLAKWGKEWRLAEEYFPAKAILVLGDIGGKLAVDKLMKLANSENGYQQLYAVQALGALAPAEAGAVVLQVAKKTTMAEVVQATLTTLPRIDYAPAIDFYVKLMGDKKEPRLKRLLAALALSLAGDERHLGALAAARGKAEAEAKKEAATAAKLKSPEAQQEAREARDLVEAFKTAEERLVAAKGCGALACWLAKVADQNPRIRDKAAYTIARLAGPSDREAAGAALVALLGDREQGVRRAALYAVTKLGAKGSIPALQTIIQNERGTEFKVLIPEYQLAIAKLSRTQS